MSTLLEIYSSFFNGQKKQFIAQVKQYGVETFTCDIDADQDSEGGFVLTDSERFKMLKTYILLTENERI